ncbi:hypothetical protein HK102_009059, partial [Quaeritorhiza haematococci]
AMQDITLQTFHAIAGWLLITAIVAQPMLIVVTSYKDDYRPYGQLYPRLTYRIDQLRDIKGHHHRDSTSVSEDSDTESASVAGETDDAAAFESSSMRSNTQNIPVLASRIRSSRDAFFVVGEEEGGNEMDGLLRGITPARIAYRGGEYHERMESAATTIVDFPEGEHPTPTSRTCNPQNDTHHPNNTSYHTTSSPGGRFSKSLAAYDPHTFITLTTPSPTSFLRLITTLNHITASWVATGSLIVGTTGFLYILHNLNRAINIYRRNHDNDDESTAASVPILLHLMR